MFFLTHPSIDTHRKGLAKMYPIGPFRGVKVYETIGEGCRLLFWWNFVLDFRLACLGVEGETAGGVKVSSPDFLQLISGFRNTPPPSTGDGSKVLMKKRKSWKMGGLQGNILSMYGIIRIQFYHPKNILVLGFFAPQFYP